MMKRRIQRTSWFQRNKKYIYIGGSAVALGVVSFTTTVLLLGSKTPEKEIVERPVEKKEYVYKTNESSIRLNPESIKKSEAEENTEIEVKEPQEEVSKLEADEEKFVANEPIEEKIVEVSTVPVKKELNFIMPIDGEILLEYAKDKLVYSKTLEEWITHNGIDIEGGEAMPVKASADGIVKDKKVDPRYGNTIIIEHEDGYKTIYSNLSTLDLVEINQEVKQGEIIAGVGSGYGFEVEEGPHVHWELYRNGTSIEPIVFSD